LQELLKTNIVIDRLVLPSTKIIPLILRELAKNKLIQAIVNDKSMHDHCNENLNLKEKGLKDISFLGKYLAHYSTINNLDLSFNEIGNAGCEHVAELLKTNKSIKKCSLR
jgi:hypothetical protein